jgi:type IV secretion system protein VirB10
MADKFQEKDLPYKKKMQFWGWVIVILLCFSLILSVFMNTKKTLQDRSGPEKKGDLAGQVSKSGLSNSAEKFQEGIERAIRHRRLRKGNETDGTEGQTQKKWQSAGFIEGNNQYDQGYEQNDIKNIRNKFKSSEMQRALNARNSKFNLTLASGQERGPAKTGRLTPVKNIETERQNITSEIERVRERIKKVQDGLLSGEQSLNKDPSSKVLKDKTIVGQPGSESGPKPGQKLIRTTTLINGVLDQTLMSDYTGSYRGLISHDVYDSTGSYVVIPKGSRIAGECLRISNVNEPIQARMGLTVKWIILPDGSRINLEKKGAALDQAGISAIKDDVNYHFFAQFMGVIAYSILGIETPYEGTGDNSDESFAGNLSESARKQFQPLASKYLNIVPTITLGIGTPLKVFLEDDIYVYPWSNLGKKLYEAVRTD